MFQRDWLETVSKSCWCEGNENGGEHTRLEEEGSKEARGEILHGRETWRRRVWESCIRVWERMQEEEEE